MQHFLPSFKKTEIINNIKKIFDWCVLRRSGDSGQATAYDAGSWQFTRSCALPLQKEKCGGKLVGKKKEKEEKETRKKKNHSKRREENRERRRGGN